MVLRTPDYIYTRPLRSTVYGLWFVTHVLDGQPHPIVVLMTPILIVRNTVIVLVLTHTDSPTYCYISDSFSAQAPYCLVLYLPSTNLGYISSYGSCCNPQLDPLVQFMALIA